MTFDVPACVKESLKELYALIEANPRGIPVDDVAEFLNMNPNGLRAALMTGTAPFGFGYRKEKDGYRTFIVPTTQFYLWYTVTPVRTIPVD